MSQQHQAQLIQMIETLLADTEMNITQLQHYARLQQRTELQQALHKIRGGYATLGAEQLARVSKDLELMLEQPSPFTEADLSEFIAIYRQSCAELHAELIKYQPDATTPHIKLNIVQLYYQLQQQDMQACDQVLACQTDLLQLFGPAGAARFSQLVLALNFSDAAAMLLPFLPDSHRADHK
ncbi:MAG TPA: Hpt domain-containing protein [Rheinheimera sp.]|nr:Hpt domain-containing protein [Rheinheimera sp.]